MPTNHRRRRSFVGVDHPASDDPASWPRAHSDHCRFAQSKLRVTGRFNWLDCVTVNKERRTIVAHARYNKAADVHELIAALHHLGFAPIGVRVLVGSES
jgi:hypothetical protein